MTFSKKAGWLDSKNLLLRDKPRPGLPVEPRFRSVGGSWGSEIVHKIMKAVGWS